METHEMLKTARRLATENLTAEQRRPLDILIDQLEKLLSDEQQAQITEIEDRRRRLGATLQQLSRAIGPSDGGYCDGAVLAFRYAEDAVLREATPSEVEDGISRAVKATRGLPRVKLPQLDVIGGAADFWLFSERPQGASKGSILRAFLCLGLQIQRHLKEYGAVPAFLLDWEGDAAYLANPRGRTLLSRSLRCAQEALLGGKAGHILLSDDCRRALSISMDGGVVQGPLRDTLARVFGCEGSQLSYSLKELPALMPSKMSAPMVAVTYSANDEVVAGGSSVYAGFTTIERREKLPGRRRGEPFIQRLATHDDCMIIGLTNEHLAQQYLIPALADRRKEGKGFWRRLVVIFASAEAAARVIEDRPVEERMHSRASGLRNVLSFLRAEDPSAKSWEVAEYAGDHLPFVGNWLSGGSPKSIRLSPVLPGRRIDETFIIELPESTVAYEEAKLSFIAIRSRSREVDEWNLLGHANAGAFQWEGIVKRSAPPTSVNPAMYKAVILVLVHGMSARGRRVYLQLRSNLNGSSDLGLYSNISGMVTVEDAYDAAGLRQPLLTSPEDEDTLIGDILGKGVLKPGEKIPDEVWLRAAIREIDEELGLKINESRLKYHGHLPMVRQDKKSSLFFRIFSLELRSTTPDGKAVSEISTIRRSMPAVGMDKGFTLRDIRGLAEEHSLNALLAANIDHFIEIYQSLKISDE